jgi:hypothetical protein
MVLVAIVVVIQAQSPNDIQQLTSVLNIGNDPCLVSVEETFVLPYASAWANIKRIIPHHVMTNNPSASISNVIGVSLNTSRMQVLSTKIEQFTDYSVINLNVHAVEALPVTVTLLFNIRGAMGAIKDKDTLLWTIKSPYRIFKSSIQVLFPKSFAKMDPSAITISAPEATVTNKTVSIVRIDRFVIIMPNTNYDISVAIPLKTADCTFVSNSPTVGLSRGAIIGIAVGGSIAACLFCGCFVFTILLCACGYVRRKKAKNSLSQYDYSSIPTDETTPREKRSIGVLLAMCCTSIASIFGDTRNMA